MIQHMATIEQNIEHASETLSRRVGNNAEPARLLYIRIQISSHAASQKTYR